eukprot:4436862-Amphidinium_carterae.1
MRPNQTPNRYAASRSLFSLAEDVAAPQKIGKLERFTSLRNKTHLKSLVSTPQELPFRRKSLQLQFQIRGAQPTPARVLLWAR